MPRFTYFGKLLAALTLVFGIGCTADIAPPPADAVWIDVRTAEEYAQGHLAQATLIPHDVIEKGVAELQLPKDTSL